MTNRLKEMSEIIKEKGHITVRELMGHFNVSDMTIRRDLQKLEQTEEFQRYHGGVRFIEPTHSKRVIQYTNEKERIAAYCVSLIQAQDTIFLDSGTTAYKIAEALAKLKISDVTVITNSLTTAYQLRYAKHISLIMCGGELRHTAQAFVGSTTREFLRNIYVNKAFIGTTGIVMEGFSTFHFSDAEIKQLMVNSSDTTIIMTDATKFGNRTLNIFSSLDDVDLVVTDYGVSNKWDSVFEKQSCKLIKV